MSSSILLFLSLFLFPSTTVSLNQEGLYLYQSKLSLDDPSSSLSNNYLNLSLQPSLSTCRSLRHLDLSHNLLTGPLPHFDLSGNNFSGPSSASTSLGPHSLRLLPHSTVALHGNDNDDDFLRRRAPMVKEAEQLRQLVLVFV